MNPALHDDFGGAGKSRPSSTAMGETQKLIAVSLVALSACVRPGLVDLVLAPAAAESIERGDAEIIESRTFELPLNRVTWVDRLWWGTQVMIAPGGLGRVVPIYVYAYSKDKIEDGIVKLQEADKFFTGSDLYVGIVEEKEESQVLNLCLDNQDGSGESWEECLSKRLEKASNGSRIGSSKPILEIKEEEKFWIGRESLAAVR